MEILLVLCTGLINVLCFFVGVKTAQTITKGKEVELPKIPSPVTLYKAHTERKQAEAENNRLDVILRNLERYDGTGNNQEDVPR